MYTTSRDYTRPFRRWPIRLTNGVLRPIAGRLPAFDAEALLTEARRRERFDDMGDPDLSEALEHLCAAITTEADLHPIGHMISRARLLDTLTARLRARRLELKHPEITEMPIDRPVFITGLSRSGTTMLQRLLSSDPSFRALQNWESMQPIPTVPDRRQQTIRWAIRFTQWMAPDYYATHPTTADDIEEDILLLEGSLLSSIPEAMLGVGSYARWVDQQDQTPAYRVHRRYLQHLSWQSPHPGRWVLKSPHHLDYLDTLLDVYPDALVIHTHRDPLQTLPSHCSMLAHILGMMSDTIDLEQIAEHWLQRTVRSTQRAAESVQRHPTSFLHVDYDDLMADPIGQLESVYDFLGADLSSDAREAIGRTLQERPQHSFGRHDYDGRDFGLTPELLAAAFKDYRAAQGFDHSM